MPLYTLLFCIAVIIIQVLTEYRHHTFQLFNPKYIFELYYLIILPFPNFIIDALKIQVTDTRTAHLFTGIDRFTVSLCIMVGFFCFVVGTAVFQRVRFKPWWFLNVEWKEKRVRPLCFILIIFGYASFFVMMRRAGGISSFLNNIQAFRNTGLIGQGFLIYPATNLLSMCFMIFMVTRDKEDHSFRAKLKFVFMLLLCTFPSMLMGFRGKALCTYLEVIALYYMYERKIKLGTLIKIVISFIVVFTAYGIFRELNSLSSSTLVYVLNNRPDLMFNSILRIKGSEIFGVVYKQLQSTHDFQYGYKTIFEALTIMIPHGLWPGKPVAKSVLFSETFFGLNGGVSPTILTEIYWDFGFFGITLGMFLFGMMYSLVFNTIMSRETNSSKVIFASLFYIGFLFAENISGTLNGLVTYIVFYVMIMTALTVRINGR